MAIARCLHSSSLPCSGAWPRLLIGVLFAALQGGLAPGAGAQPLARGVHMQVGLGFADSFRPGRWTPLTVTVSNTGPALAGTLEVITHDGDEFRRRLYPVIQQRHLELGREARRRFHFTVFLESVAHPVVVRIVAGDRELVRRTIDLRQHFGAGRMLVVLSRDADLDYLNEQEGSGLRVVYPHPDLLPHSWQGYDAVAGVVVHGLSLESLSPPQFEALRRWLARGGILAVSGGPDYSVLRTPRLAALMPALPAGMLRVNVDQAPAVGEALGAPLSVTRPFQLNRLARRTADATVAAAGLPLVLESRHGLGRVVYLTFDVARYPFDRWSPMKDVWTRVLALERDGPAPVHGPDDVSLAASLLSTRGRGFPGHGTLLAFIALYLGLLATSHRMRARSRDHVPGPGAGLAAWAVPMMFAPAAYLLFGPVLFERGSTATIVSVIEPLPDSAYARLRVDLGLHANRPGSLQLEYAGAQPVFRVPFLARREVGNSGWRFDGGSLPGLAPESPRIYTLHLLEGQDVIPFDLRAAVTSAGGRTLLRLQNDSGHTLDAAWLVHRGAAWYLGTVSAGEVLERDLGIEPQVLTHNRDEWWEVLERDPRAAPGLGVMAPVLAARADALDERRYPGNGHALVMGFTSSPLRPAGTSAAWRRDEVALVLLHFAARIPARDPSPGDADDETT